MKAERLENVANTAVSGSFTLGSLEKLGSEKTPVIQLIGRSEGDAELIRLLDREGVSMSVMRLQETGKGNAISIFCEYLPPQGPYLFATFARPLVLIAGIENLPTVCELLAIEVRERYLEIKALPDPAYALDLHEGVGHMIPTICRVRLIINDGVSVCLVNNGHDPKLKRRLR